MATYLDPPWPLVGRTDALAHITRNLCGGRPRGVVLVGASGVGKTRLAKEALSYAARTAVHGRAAPEPVWIVATPGNRDLPLGAFAHLAPAEPAADADRLALIRATAATLLGRSGGNRLVIGVDDAHLLDQTSAALLYHLAAHEHAVVLTTLRDGAPVPDAITALWKDELAERIEVPPLDLEGVREVAETLLGGSLDQTSQRRLWRDTGGNPLYLRELLAADRPLFAVRDGMWRYAGSPALLPRIVELVESRIGRLPVPERETLELVAVGEPLELAFVESLAHDPATELERLGLLDVQARDGRWQAQLAHPLYGEVVRSRMPRLRTRAVRRQLADALAATGARRRGDLLRLATWRLDGGGSAPASLLIDAAQQALARHDPALALRLTDAAFTGGAGQAARHVRAKALLASARYADADRLLASCAEDATTPAARAAATITRAHSLYWNLDQVDRALAVLQEATDTLDDPPLNADLTGLAGSFRCFSGDVSAAIATMRSSDADMSPRGKFQTSMYAGVALAMAGRTADALRATDAGAEAAAAWLPHVPDALARVRSHCAYAHIVAGQWQQAHRDLAAAHADMCDHAEGGLAAIHAVMNGWLYRLQGQPGTALRWLRGAVTELRRADPRRQLGGCHAEIAHALALLGDADGAAVALGQAQRHACQAFGMHENHHVLARMWAAVARGDPSLAYRIGRTGAEAARARGQSVHEATALHDCVRLGHAAKVADRLAEIAADCDGLLVPAYARHGVASAARDGAALDAAAGEFAAIGALLFASEAAASASQAHHRNGRVGSSLASTRHSAEYAARCEGARTPGLAGPRRRWPLTRREHEVADLAGQGLTSQSIADRLVLSRRTVDNHLTRVYAKLAISGRDELRRLTQPAG
ncbi:MAG: AAA family ATPase [Micromonosporaceae bacterium]